MSAWPEAVPSGSLVDLGCRSCCAIRRAVSRPIAMPPMTGSRCLRPAKFAAGEAGHHSLLPAAAQRILMRNPFKREFKTGLDASSARGTSIWGQCGWTPTERNRVTAFAAYGRLPTHQRRPRLSPSYMGVVVALLSPAAIRVAPNTYPSICEVSPGIPRRSLYGSSPEYSNTPK